MKLSSYLKDQWVTIALMAVVVVFVALFLRVFIAQTYAIWFVLMVILLACVIALVYGYTRKNAYYRQVRSIYQQLDQRYLISELMDAGDFLDSRIFYEILTGANKSMNDRIAQYKKDTEEYREYLESWVHEIKTPISSARLTLENHPGKVAESIIDDFDRVEALVMNVLYYARSSSVEKDYIVKRVSLESMVDEALKRNSRRLIANKIKVERHNLQIDVYTDPKWMGFILDQLISNSIQYKKGEKDGMGFSARVMGEGVELSISDGGVGVPPEDLPRIFDKGFTGKSGRRHSAATGMGLYLVQQLCKRLGLSIRAISGTEGTTISIYFPKSDTYIMDTLSKT